MPSPVTIQCPGCQAKLKLKDSGKLGKKIGCPKCGKPFIAKAAKAKAPQPDDELAGLDDFSDDDYGEPAAAPQARRRPSAGKSAKSKKKPAAKASGGNPGLLIAGIAAVALLLIGGGGFLVFSLLGTGGDEPVAAVVDAGGQDDQAAPAAADPSAAGSGTPAASANTAPAARADAGRLNLAYLHPDSELFIRLAPAAVWDSPLLQVAVGSPMVQMFVEQMRQEAGLHPTDIASVTVGIPNVFDKAQQGATGDLTSLADSARTEVVGTVQFSKAMDLDDLAKRIERQGGQRTEYAGNTIYRMVTPGEENEDDAFALCFVSPTMAVFGDEDTVKQSIDRGGETPSRSDLEFVDPSQHLLLVFVPTDKRSLLGQMPRDEDDPDEVKRVQASLEQVNAMSIGLKLTGGLELQLATNSADAAAAESLRQGVTDLIAYGRTAFEEAKDESPPLLTEVVEQLLSGFQTTGEGTTATFTASLPGTLLAKIGEEAAQFASAFGGRGPGPAPVEIPEDLQMEASAQWDRGPHYGPDGEEKSSLLLVVDLVGGPAAEAIAYGHLSLTTAATEEGQPLKQRNAYGEEFDGFASIDREAFAMQRQGGVRATFHLAPPEPDIERLGKLEGTVALRLPTGSKDLTFDNFAAQAGQTLSHPELEQAGLRLKVEKNDDALVVRREQGEPGRLGRFVLVDGDGQPIENMFTTESRFEDDLSFTIYEANRLPQNAKLKVPLYDGFRDIAVPFEFEGVAVPLSPWSPGVPPSNADEIPEGFTVGAKVRWSDERFDFETFQEGPPPLEITVELTGEQAAAAVAWGHAKATRTVADGGQVLKPRKYQHLGEDATAKFLRIGRDAFGEPDLHPEEGVRAVFRFAHPDQPVSAVASFEGAVRVQSVKETKEIVFEDLSTLSGKALAHPDLGSADLGLKLDKQDNGLRLSVQRGVANVLGKVEVVDDEGESIPGAFVSREEVNRKVSYLIDLDDDTAGNARLKLTLHLGLATTQVPLKFENIPVPPAPKD